MAHRTKRPEDRNATAVMDRTIQTLKKDLAGEVAREGGKWDDHVAAATEAYNARPHEAVHAASEDTSGCSTQRQGIDRGLWGRKGAGGLRLYDSTDGMARKPCSSTS